MIHRVQEFCSPCCSVAEKVCAFLNPFGQAKAALVAQKTLQDQKTEKPCLFSARVRLHLLMEKVKNVFMVRVVQRSVFSCCSTLRRVCASLTHSIGQSKVASLVQKILQKPKTFSFILAAKNTDLFSHCSIKELKVLRTCSPDLRHLVDEECQKVLQVPFAAIGKKIENKDLLRIVQKGYVNLVQLKVINDFLKMNEDKQIDFVMHYTALHAYKGAWSSLLLWSLMENRTIFKIITLLGYNKVKDISENNTLAKLLDTSTPKSFFAAKEKLVTYADIDLTSHVAEILRGKIDKTK